MVAGVIGNEVADTLAKKGTSLVSASGPTISYLKLRANKCVNRVGKERFP